MNPFAEPEHVEDMTIMSSTGKSFFSENHLQRSFLIGYGSFFSGIKLLRKTITRELVAPIAFILTFSRNFALTKEIIELILNQLLRKYYMIEATFRHI